MRKILGSLKLRVFVLAVLVGLTFQLGWSSSITEACEKCVQLSGALCVGCQESPFGYPVCTPIQETCTCNVTPGSCRIGGIEP